MVRDRPMDHGNRGRRSGRARAPGGGPVAALALAACLAAVVVTTADAGQLRTGRLRAHAALAFANGYESQLACASANECTAITNTGLQVTFNPTRAGKLSESQTIPTADYPSTFGITCPSSARCIVADAHGEAAVFDPTRPSDAPASFLVALGSTPQAASMSCPTTTFCAALAAVHGAASVGVLSFNPRRPGDPHVTAIAQSTLEFLTCTSTKLCAAAGARRGCSCSTRSPRGTPVRPAPLRRRRRRPRVRRPLGARRPDDRRAQGRAQPGEGAEGGDAGSARRRHPDPVGAGWRAARLHAPPAALRPGIQRAAGRRGSRRSRGRGRPTRCAGSRRRSPRRVR